jgi:hypothetical protein
LQAAVSTGGEHCILVQLGQPVDQKTGLDVKSLEAYKGRLHAYVWQELEPLAVDGGFHVVPERWVFEVDDPAGGTHATDVVFGGLDPALFRRLFATWRQRPLEAALRAASAVPDGRPGYRRADIEAVWADPSRVIDAFSQESLVDRRRWMEVDDDLNAPEWELDRRAADRLASGFYAYDADFFSLPHGSSKLTHDQVAEVEGHPQSYALVFVPARH